MNKQFYKFPSKINSIFTLDQKTIIDFFSPNVAIKNRLFSLADNFVNKKINIYQKKIDFTEYNVSNFHIKRSDTNIFNKDIRFHWEIYRSKYLFNVGMAYYVSNDEKYSTALIDYIDKWQNFCPIFDKSILYNGMEAGIKIINLYWVDYFLKDSLKYQKYEQKKLIGAIIIHAEYIYRNYDISIYGLEANHSLSCGVGLIFTSLLFPDYSKGAKWYKFGNRIVKRALKKQFSADGVNFESSIQYHRYVFELLMIMLASLFMANKKIDSATIHSIKKIGEALLELRHCNKLIPRIGDNDGGKIFYDLNTIEEFNRLEYLDWFTAKKRKTFYETLIFENITQFKNFLNPDKRNRVCNYLTFKDPDISLIIVGHKIGTSGKGNHQHNDFLSFELYSKYPFIVDPWSYCFTGNKELRNKDRKTNSHNTIMLDGRDIIEFNPDRLFEMLGNIKVDIEKIEDNNEKWEAVLKHNGYKNLKNGCQTHQRTFIYDKINTELTIIDYLYGKGEHSANLNFHIPQKYWDFKQLDKVLIFSNKNEEFSICNNLGIFKVEEDFISENYLNRIKSYHIYFETFYMEQLFIETKINYRNVR